MFFYPYKKISPVITKEIILVPFLITITFSIGFDFSIHEKT